MTPERPRLITLQGWPVEELPDALEAAEIAVRALGYISSTNGTFRDEGGVRGISVRFSPAMESK